MPLEFALRPRFDLNRPPKRRRLPGLELPPYALPVAAYWLAIAGGTYALVQSRAAEASSEARPDVGFESSRSTDAVPNDAPNGAWARWSARAQLGGAAVTPTVQALEPAPAAPPQDPAPRSHTVVDAAPGRETAADRASAPNGVTALDRRLASPHEAPRLTQRRAPRIAHHDAPPSPPAARLERPEEPLPRHDEVPSRVLEPEAPRRQAPSTALPSCEAAADTANQIIDLGGSRGAPDLTRDAFAAVLESGSYLNACAIPARTALEVCAAVRDGQVVGVTVTTQPRDAAISACVRRAVAGLRFPRSSRLDVTRTRFESAR